MTGEPEADCRTALPFAGTTRLFVRTAPHSTRHEAPFSRTTLQFPGTTLQSTGTTLASTWTTLASTGTACQSAGPRRVFARHGLQSARTALVLTGTGLQSTWRDAPLTRTALPFPGTRQQSPDATLASRGTTIAVSRDDARVPAVSIALHAEARSSPCGPSSTPRGLGASPLGPRLRP